MLEFHLWAGHHSANHDVLSDLLSPSGGLTWYGGFFLVCLILFRYFFGRPQSRVLPKLDALAVATALAYGIGRLACLFSGDGCYGTWTNLPWGMHFEYGTSPSLLPVHPTPLYESLLSLLLFAFLIARQRPPGRTLLYFLLASAGCRYSIEFIRNNEPVLGHHTLAQLFSIFILIACSTVVLWQPKSQTP